MNPSLIPRRFGLQGLGFAAIGLFLLGAWGCGSSSSNGNLGNGNLGNTTTTTTGTGTPGGSSTPGLNSGGFWTVPPGTPLVNTALPTGTWEGYYATDTGGSAVLTVSSTGALLTLFCGRTAQFSQPIVLDAKGSFVAQGTGSLLPPATGAVYLSGQVAVSTVDGKTTTNLLLSVGDAPPSGDGISNAAYGTYDMTLGSTYAAGVCP